MQAAPGGGGARLCFLDTTFSLVLAPPVGKVQISATDDTAMALPGHACGAADRKALLQYTTSPPQCLANGKVQCSAQFAADADPTCATGPVGAGGGGGFYA